MLTPETIRSRVPNTPELWVGFIAGLSDDLIPMPFPPKSWLYQQREPFGWTWGTDTWSMTLVPKRGGWVVSYCNDHGERLIFETPEQLHERMQS